MTTKTAVLTSDAINEAILAVFEQAKNGVFGGSLNFEEAFFDAFSKKLGPLGFQCFDKANSKYPKDCKHRKDLIHRLSAEGKPYLAFQPEGSQRSPDLRLSYGSILEEETKSTKQGTVMWNCGLPRKDTIYTIVKGKTMDVTFALGQDMLLPEHYAIAKEGHRKIADGPSEKLITRLRDLGCPITYYPRPMYQDYRNWFEDRLRDTPVPNRKDREENVLRFIRAFKWEQ